MKDLVQARAIEEAIRKTKIQYATEAVEKAKRQLLKAEADLKSS